MSYVLKESFGTTADDYESVQTSWAVIRGAMSFVTASAYVLTQAEHMLTKVGTPSTYNLTAYIYSDGVGKPGTLLGTSINTIPVSSLSTSSGTYYAFQFAGVSLSSSTTYYMAIAGDDTVDTNYWRMWSDSTSETGIFSRYEAPDWVEYYVSNIQGMIKTYVYSGPFPFAFPPMG
jgi:hypothetical protein